MASRLYKLKAVTLSIFSVVLVYLFIDNSDIFLERTQMNLARSASGLNLKNGCKIVKFEKDIPITSDGFINIEIKFNENELDEILVDARNKGYKKITQENLFKDKIIDSIGRAILPLNKKSVMSIKNGVYHFNAASLKVETMEFTLTSIDVDSMNIFIESIID
jgi:hypothetical protein